MEVEGKSEEVASNSGLIAEFIKQAVGRVGSCHITSGHSTDGRQLMGA